MKRLIHILSFVFLLSIVMESCSKIEPLKIEEPEGCEPGWVCGTTTSDDPIIYPISTNENNSEKDITDSEDDEDQDRDVNTD